MEPLQVTYCPRELDKIENELLHAAENGNPREFAVFVDREPVIERTEDIEQFYRISGFVIPGVTQKVQIRLYKGYSNHHLTYTLFVEPEKSTTGESLNGVDFERRMETERLRWDHKALEEKYQTLKEDQRELEGYAKELEGEVERLRQKKFHFGEVNLLEVGGGLLEGIIRRNPHLLSHIPGGESLAGAFQQPGEHPTPPQPESEVHFEEAEDETDLANAISGLPDQNREQLGIVIHHLSHRPDLIPPVLGLIEDELKTSFTPQF